MERWHEEIIERRGNDIKLLVIGNKLDIKENREISIAKGEEFATRIGSEFMEVSAKSGQNVDEILPTIVRSITSLKDVTIEKEKVEEAIKLNNDGGQGNRFICC